MSQQGQAENLHQEATQKFEEARSLLADLNAKHSAGDLSAEALASEEKRIDKCMQEADALFKRAQQLSTINRRQDTLRGMLPDSVQDDVPDYLRPMGSGSGIAKQSHAAPHRSANTENLSSSFSPEECRRVGRMAGIHDPSQICILSGRARELLNAYLRGNRVQGNTLVDAKGMQFLYSGGVESATPGTQAEHLNVNPYVDTDGGFIVSHEVRTEVITHLRDALHLRTLSNVITTTAESVTLPVIEGKLSMEPTRANGSSPGNAVKGVGGIFGKTELRPSGKMLIIKIPEQLLQDTQWDLIGYLSQQISEQSFEDEERQFLTGNGQNEPYGVLSAGIQGYLHTGTGGADFIPEDIVAFDTRMRRAVRRKCVWVCHRSFVRSVRTMRTEDGGAGTGDFLFKAGGKAGDLPELSGYPLIDSEFFPDHIDPTSSDTKNTGDPLALFGNFMDYWIAENPNYRVKGLDQLYAEEQMYGVRYEKRIDGAPVRLESFITLDRK